MEKVNKESAVRDLAKELCAVVCPLCENMDMGTFIPFIAAQFYAYERKHKGIDRTALMAIVIYGLEQVDDHLEDEDEHDIPDNVN